MMSSIYDPYASAPTLGKELDLRTELHKTLYGATDEVAKGKIGLLRIMRKDSEGDLIRCPCRNKLTDEPDRDKFCRYCVVGSTLIPTESGIKTVKEVIPGMSVLGKDSKFHLVTNTFGRIYSGEMIEIHIAGRSRMPLKLTADHPVFVYRNTNICHQKKAYGKICMPEFCHAAACKAKTLASGSFGFDLLEIPAGELLMTDYLLTPKLASSNCITRLSVNWLRYGKRGIVERYNFSDDLLIDNDLMFLFGWFVAEGSGSNGGRKSRSVVYSLNSETELSIANELLRIYKEKFGISGIVLPAKSGKKSMQVVFNCSILSRWLNDICGRYSDYKIIPDFIWSCDPQLQKVFVDSFMDGDGHRDNDKTVTTGIVSKILAEGIWLLAIGLGYYPSIAFKPAYTGSDGQAHSDSWVVYWLEEQGSAQRLKWRIRFSHENFIVSSISDIKRSIETVAVYDLTVSDVSSFVADGLLVHNCHGHGYFWDEHKIVYYKNDDSFRKREGRVQEYEGDLFYLEYSDTVSPGDFVIEISLDNDGVPVQPVERLKVYDIISADHFRADNGRVEYWRLRAKFRREWSVWYGVKNRQHS